MNWDLLLFLKAWARSPRKIGAVIPSSTSLAKAMADQVTVVPGRAVVELGAGTGAVTQALLERGVNPKDLIVIESDAVFCSRLRQRFPEIRILNIDATRLEQVFQRHRIDNLDTIVSSLPLLSLDRRSQRAILEQSFDLLGQDGAFIQYTYGVGSPVRKQFRQVSDVDGFRVKQIWRNLPPATIWLYRSRQGQVT
jgi:phosphatidylethanolamine/phosphatidyl-N-methylethanolamine N-methyltransferase